MSGPGGRTEARCLLSADGAKFEQGHFGLETSSQGTQELYLVTLGLWDPAQCQTQNEGLAQVCRVSGCRDGIRDKWERVL